MRTLPLLSWPGGKSRHLKRLLPHVPAAAGYIEAFAGGCALLLAKPKSRLEVVNDTNGDITNLYRCAARHPDELARSLRELPPASREQTTISRNLLKTHGVLTDIQRAAIFLHLNKTSFAGSGTSLAIQRNPNARACLGTSDLIERIARFRDRFDSVVIEQLDYRRLLDLYDHPGNFIFLDPPYGVSSVKNYAGWGEADLTEFRDRVTQLKARWLVTLDDSPHNRSLWAGHDIDYHSTRNGAGNQAQGLKVFGEMFIHSPGLRTPSNPKSKPNH
jgi:DNA adenine methylase